MTDTQTTSYQAAQIHSSEEANASIFSQLPDQFTKYEDKTYNPIDFYTSSGEYNLSLFNKTFREEQLKRIDFFRNQELKRLQELNNQVKPKPKFTELSIGEHMIKMKDTFFGIISDLETKKFSINIFLKDYRLFYIGLFLVIVFIIFLILSNLLATANNQNTS
jgi:hypothetical protein